VGSNPTLSAIFAPKGAILVLKRLGQRVLFWAWLHGREGSTVIVLSCFEVQEGTG